MVRPGSEVLCGERKPARKPIHRASPAFDALCANDHLDCQGRSARFVVRISAGRNAQARRQHAHGQTGFLANLPQLI